MVWLIAAVVLGGQDVARQLKEVADRVHDTVIEVRASASAAGVQAPTFGTGVLIGGGLALTTLHTVSNGADVEVLAQGSSTPMSAKVVGGFPQIDLALLRIDNAGGLPSAPLAEQPPAVGDALIAIGAVEESVRAVGVNVLALNGDLVVLASNRRVDSRFWGGPIFDTQGRLVAIALSTLALPGAITASAVRNLLQQAAPK